MRLLSQKKIARCEWFSQRMDFINSLLLQTINKRIN
jgi:hypothetical protein